MLNKQSPYRFGNNMKHGMAEHGILDAVFAEEITEDQPCTAVEQETADQNQRCQFSEYQYGCRDMSCGKEKRGNHIGNDENFGWSGLFLAEKDFPKQKGKE